MMEDFFEFGMLKPIPYFVAASLIESPSLVSVPWSWWAPNMWAIWKKEFVRESVVVLS